MKKYGCIGKKLTHSFSKEIHAKLADYNYELIELGEDDIKPFFTEKNFEAINVTIPYKETVIPYLDSVSDIAKRIGAVNTIVNKNGKLYGYNTDYIGKLFKSNFNISLKKYIDLQRLNLAKDLLMTTLKSVKQIAYEIGYTDENLFIKFFMYHEKMSPTVFRNKYFNTHINNK